MRNFNRCYLIFQLCAFLIFFHTTSYAGQPSDSAEAALVNTIYQIKTVLIKQLRSADIEEMINKARDIGATGYKLNHYSGGKMGWSIEDSRRREVNSVIFTFLGHRAKVGAYYGPLMSFKDAKVIHNWHNNTLSTYFKQIDTNKYDINDNCVAIMDLFKGTTGLGRTIITVECH